MAKEWIVPDADLGCVGAYFGYQELVRCRECKHHEYEEPGMVYCPKIVGAWVGENWFCADGEREVQE